MLGKRCHNVRNTYFEDNIHTAFKVKTKSDLRLKAILIRINSEILHRVFVVLLCNRVLYLCNLAVIVACGNRE